MDKKGRSHFSSLQSALSFRNYSNMRIYLFDLLYFNREDLRNRPLKERKLLLKSILANSHSPIFFSEDINRDGVKFFKMACRYKLEGVVSKDSNAPYQSGRSRAWFKSKCHQRQEFVIAGYTEGKGTRDNQLRALLLGVYEIVDGYNKLRYVGKVGTGLDDKTVTELRSKVLKLKQKNSSFDIKSPKERNIYWIKPELVAEIKFSEWTADQILRAPVFLGLRNDKKSWEIVIEKATSLSKTNYKEKVVLTHPKKILFSLEKITKQMIADYYELVADLMLPHISDRPLSLVRCPQGTDEECFYQKHPIEGFNLSFFKIFKVKEKSHTNLYLSVDSSQGLKQLVQMNAFEIHTWNSHYQMLLHPNQIVLDLDPDPEVSFKTLVRACIEMKKILDKLKLKSFVKVTGGKGLHIHIPIEPIYTWEQTFDFARALAEEMVLRKPKDFVATMSKERRKGKIFVDYFRNSYGATAIAPYSLRVKKITAVALPVEWSELSKLKSSDQFTLKKALLKIKKRKSDPWKKLLSIKQKIIILE